MKKKVVPRERSAAKPEKTNPIRERRTLSAKKPPVPHLKPILREDPIFTQAVQNYEGALRAMQERKFEKAKGLLERIIATGPRELADRARLHLNTCNQQLSEACSKFKTDEEHFDYAFSLMNAGRYDQARTHLERILKQNSQADFAYYGMAVVECLAGQVKDSLKNLRKAIELNPQNRFQARTDSDFQNIADDPRFVELIGEDSVPELSDRKLPAQTAELEPSASQPSAGLSKESGVEDDLARDLAKVPTIRQAIEEEAVAQRYVLARYRTLINRRFQVGLSSQETEELEGLQVTLDNMDEPFYEGIIKRLLALVQKGIVS